MARRHARTTSRSKEQEGQMLLGGLLFLLLSAAGAVGLLAAASRVGSHLHELAQTREAAFEDAGRTAALLNDLSMNQALLLWHGAGALHAQTELRDALLLSASSRFYGRTPETAKSLSKPEGLASLRNALSNVSSRHLTGIVALLARNASLHTEIAAREPGFFARVRREPIGDAFCRVAAHWTPRPTFSVPALSLLSAGAAGRTSLEFDEAACADIYPLLPTPATKPALTVSSPRREWRAFATRSRLPPGSDVLFTWRAIPGEQEVFLRKRRSKSGRFEVVVAITHPRFGEEGALFEPRWAPLLVESRATVGGDGGGSAGRGAPEEPHEGTAPFLGGRRVHAQR